MNIFQAIGFGSLLVGIESILLFIIMVMLSFFDKDYSLSSVIRESLGAVLLLFFYRMIFLHIPLVVAFIYGLKRYTGYLEIDWRFGFFNAGLAFAIIYVYSFYNEPISRFLHISKPYFGNIVLITIFVCLISPVILQSIRK